MAVIGIAGLPGSGKSTLMNELQKQGYSPYDNINVDWNGNLPRARTEAHQGKDVAISDIMFCKESMRRRLERELELTVQWISFENIPWQCARNCLYRFMFANRDKPRSLDFEIGKIIELSPVFKPVGDIRPVVRADAMIAP